MAIAFGCYGGEQECNAGYEQDGYNAVYTFPCITSKKKNSKISRMVKMDPKAIIFMERSFCVRMTFASTFLPPISLAASPTALFIMPP